MKRLLLFSILTLLSFNCSRYFYYPHKEQKPVVLDEVLRSKGKSKIALVGFYPYKSSSKFGIMRSEYMAELDYSRSTKELFLYGTSIDSIPTNGINSKVSKEDTNLFIRTFLEANGESGKVELEKIFEISGTDKKAKKRDVDFYLVGVHLPHYQERIPSALTAFTGIFGVLTLGLVPMYEDFATITFIYVYDKDLKPIVRMHYQNKYRVISALWMIPNEGFQFYFSQDPNPPMKAFENDIQYFNEDIKMILKEVKYYGK